MDEFFELIEENISKVNHYFKTVFRTFRKHKQYIKNALETHYSNAKLEGTNKLIKDIKRLGFGFRNFINFRKRVFITLNIRPIRSSLDVSFSSPTTVDKHTKISSEEISDGREYSLLFLYVKVVVSCKVVGLYGARRRLTNWQDTLF